MMLRQIELEEKMVQSGIERAHKSAEAAEKHGRAHTTVYARRMIKAVIEPLTEAVQNWHDNAPVRGQGAKLVRLMRQVPAEQSALITISEVMKHLRQADSAGVDNTVIKWGTAIGRMLEDEARFSAFKRTHADYMHAVMQDFKKRGTTNYRYMHRVLTHAANKLGQTWLAWCQQERAQIGVTLLRLAQESTGIFSFEKVIVGRRQLWIIKPTEEFVQWSTDCVDAMGTICPVSLPCLVQPDDWISNDSGGYWTPKLRVRYQFVKLNNRGHKIKPFEAGLALPMKAVNAIQSTPWRVNPNVKPVLVEVWSKGLGCGLPLNKPLDIPTCPIIGKEKEDFTEDEMEVFQRWKHEAAQMHIAEKERISKSFQVASTMQLASEFCNEDRIYFPFQTDTRGRMYAIPSGMSPQGPNFGKGLLEFAEGRPLGAGVDWWLVHGANVLGKDKISYTARAQYMRDNLDEFVRVANDPIGTRELWGNADKPWQFLAWCFEARGFAYEGESFVSHLPVALDGSCNGLQHFSAMLRDHIGGKATNLMDAELPADIYKAVADVCIAKLMLEDDPLAKRWLQFGIDRSLCKKPVMTMPYGSTRQACMQSVYGCIVEKDKEFFPKAFKAAVYLTKFIWDSIGEVVVAARTAMDWLRKAAGTVSKAGHPLIWTAPSGFRVKQLYSNTEIRRIETTLGGCPVALNVADRPVGISAYRMRNGASPNFVHSMDAAHLVLTVNAARDHGIQNFACIHDDFGTHACDTPDFFRIIREEFVGMYEKHDPLEEMRASVKGYADIDLPEVPQHGALDIRGVLESKYFFG